MATIRTTDGRQVNILMKDLPGRSVKTRQPLKNGYMTIPAGTVCTVDGHWRSGVSLSSPACKCCGISVFIGGVHRDSVELVPEE